MKHCAIFEYGHLGSYHHLRRECILVEGGCYVKANAKYIEEAAALLGLAGSKPVATPLATGDRKDSLEESPALSAEQHSLYRRVVGALL